MKIDSGDTAWVLASAALVMLMTPALGFFYGGLVRRKNFLAIMMQSFISMGIVTTIWVTVGYSLAFSGDIGGFIVAHAAERKPYRLSKGTIRFTPDKPLPDRLVRMIVKARLAEVEKAG